MDGVFDVFEEASLGEEVGVDVAFDPDRTEVKAEGMENDELVAVGIEEVGAVTATKRLHIQR
jgi:hypothetical protein